MMGFGFGGLGWLFMVIFWGAVIGLAVWVLSKLFPHVTDTSSSRPKNNSPEPPLEILRHRYARGEISGREYETMRRDLTD